MLNWDSTRSRRSNYPQSMTTIGSVGLGKMGILHAGILNALPNTHVEAACEKESKLTKKVIPKIFLLWRAHYKAYSSAALEMVEQSDLHGHLTNK